MPALQSKYHPRAYFRAFHQRNQRWATMVAHRRAGKTVAAVNDLIEKASYNTRVCVHRPAAQAGEGHRVAVPQGFLRPVQPEEQDKRVRAVD